MRKATIKSGVILTATLFVTACDGIQAKIDTPPQTVNFTSQVAQERAAGTDTITVRARSVSEVGGQKKTVELVGVGCEVVGNGFNTRLVTPAKIDAPVYLGRTDPLTARCTYNGQQVEETLNAYRIKSHAPTPIGLGLAGILVMAAVNAAAEANRNPAADNYGYPSKLNVDFPATQVPE